MLCIPAACAHCIVALLAAIITRLPTGAPGRQQVMGQHLSSSSGQLRAQKTLPPHCPSSCILLQGWAVASPRVEAMAASHSGWIMPARFRAAITAGSSPMDTARSPHLALSMLFTKPAAALCFSCSSKGAQ